MHPSVHENAPGKCPICGMNLVPAGTLVSHDHRALHGGQVSMSGDHHVEYLAADGEYRFWVTNATRDPIPASTGTVKDGDTTLALTADANGMLTARGEGAGTRPVLVEVTTNGTTFSLGFNPMGAEAAHEDHHAH